MHVYEPRHGHDIIINVFAINQCIRISIKILSLTFRLYKFQMKAIWSSLNNIWNSFVKAVQCRQNDVNFIRT